MHWSSVTGQATNTGITNTRALPPAWPLHILYISLWRTGYITLVHIDGNPVQWYISLAGLKCTSKNVQLCCIYFHSYQKSMTWSTAPLDLTNNSLEWEISTHSCLKNVEAFSLVGRLSETQTDPWWLSWQFLGFRTTVLQKKTPKKTRPDIHHSSENLEKSNNHQFFEDFEITRTHGSFSDFDFCRSTGTQKLFSISEII